MSVGTQFLARINEEKTPEKASELDRHIETMDEGMLEEDVVDHVATAKKILKALGVDFSAPVFRGDNQAMIERQIRTAVRNIRVRQAMAAFARIIR